MGAPKRKRNDDQLLIALASGKSVPAAARQCGVCERTVYRRLQEADFQARLTAVRADLVTRTAGQLSAAGQKAVDTLRELLKAEYSPAVRLGAAKAVLELGQRLREANDLEDRIAELEGRLADAEQDHSRTL